MTAQFSIFKYYNQNTRTDRCNPQAAWEVEGNRPDDDWPSEGQVEFKDYKVRYRPRLDLVLKGLSFKVEAGEKVDYITFGNKDTYII